MSGNEAGHVPSRGGIGAEGDLRTSSGSGGIVIGGRSIEDLFARKPSSTEPTAVFHPFTPAEMVECRDFLDGVARFTHAPMRRELLAALTTMPPAFALAPDHPELGGLQAAFDRTFPLQAEAAAKDLLERVLARFPSEDEKVVVPVWRAGLCFAGVTSVEGVTHMHVGARRDPVTLKSSFYYTSELRTAEEGSPKFLVCDPMIGTGNAMIGVLEGLKTRLGDAYIEENVHVLGLFVTSEAAVRILDRFPKVSLHAATIDNHINERGWVIADDPSQFLGDFGDCYSARGLTPEKLTDLHARGVLDEASLAALQRRLRE